MDENPQNTVRSSIDPPVIDNATVGTIIEDRYGITGDVSELGGERDQNFRIDTVDGKSFVLKVANSGDNEEILDFRTKALKHIKAADPQLPVVEQVPTTDGELWTSVDDDGSHRLVRMFEFVSSVDHTISQLHSDSMVHYGEIVARVGQALRGFFHPAARYRTQWNLRYAPKHRSSLGEIENDRHRTLVESILTRFDKSVEPMLDNLRAQVIHNDLRPDNILLDENGEVASIIDFGDLTHTALVCDIAISLAGVMYRHDDPIDAAQSVLEGYTAITPLQAEEKRLLPDLIMSRLAVKGIMYSRSRTNYSHNTGDMRDIWNLLNKLEEVGCEGIRRRLQTAADSSHLPYSYSDSGEITARRRKVLGSERLSYQEPVHFVTGDGVWLFDKAGNQYLDAYNNVQSVGHANSTVSAAINNQNRKLVTNTRYLHESVIELSERLLDTMPENIDQLLFVNSGSEANDLAWQMATNWTENDGAIVTNYAYHGITGTTKELSPKYWSKGQEPTHVETIFPPDSESTHQYASTNSVDEIDKGLSNHESVGCGTAAFMFDSLFTSDGIFSPDDREMKEITENVREAGGMILADEVQAGFGRTGNNMWGFQKYNIVPDIVTLGKPMGNGYPIAAVGAHSDVIADLREQAGVFSTYGGNPVASVAALAVLNEIEELDLLSHVETTGSYLYSKLKSLEHKYDFVGNIRQEGLMCGVEIVQIQSKSTPAKAKAEDIVNYLRQRRVLIGLTGPDNCVLKIRPPLVFENNHVDHLIEVLDSAFNSV